MVERRQEIMDMYRFVGQMVADGLMVVNNSQDLTPDETLAMVDISIRTAQNFELIEHSTPTFIPFEDIVGGVIEYLENGSCTPREYLLIRQYVLPCMAKLVDVSVNHHPNSNRNIAGIAESLSTNIDDGLMMHRNFKKLLSY